MWIMSPYFYNYEGVIPSFLTNNSIVESGAQSQKGILIEHYW